MKKLLILSLVCVLFIQCNSNQGYVIKKSQVGLVSAITKVSELDKIFAKDSLVKPEYIENQSKYFSEDYMVFAKNGDHLLTVKIENPTDSTSNIQSVQVFSGLYKTDRQISVDSYFKDLKENYEIGKVESTITSASVNVKDLNASFIIPNKDLGYPEFSTNKIMADQIPDNAKFRYITVWFN